MPGSYVSARIRPREGGGSYIHIEWNREGSTFKGRMAVRIITRTKGKPVMASIEKVLGGWGPSRLPSGNHAFERFRHMPFDAPIPARTAPPKAALWSQRLEHTSERWDVLGRGHVTEHVEGDHRIEGCCGGPERREIVLEGRSRRDAFPGERHHHRRKIHAGCTDGRLREPRLRRRDRSRARTHQCLMGRERALERVSLRSVCSIP
jgi:hypothetical protein